METVVVTGASGHIGSALVRALVADGRRVRAFVHRDERPLVGLDVERRRVDVTRAAEVDEAVRGAAVVYHAAARISLETGEDPAAERVNVEGTRNVVEACERHRIGTLVHFSSAHALDVSGALLSPSQGMVYERSKAGAEREVLAAVERGLRAVVVSPAAVIGPYDHKPSFMGRVLLMMARGLLPATVDGGQSWVDVRDVASSAIAASRAGQSGARYVLDGHWMAMPEFAKLASRVARSRAPLFKVPTGLARVFAPVAERASKLVGQEPLFTRASIDALEPTARPHDRRSREELGHGPRPTAETLEDTFRWFEDQGMLRRRA